MMKKTGNPGRQAIYLNTAAAGLLSEASAEAATAFTRRLRDNPSEAFSGWMKTGLPILRRQVARLLGCDAARIAFVPNFSYGLGAVVHSLSGRLRRVLLFDEDYPSVNLPVVLGDFEVHYVSSQDGFSVPLSAVADQITRHRIEAVVISHVQYLTGFMVDLEELALLCEEEGVWLIVDATQSLGAADYDFSVSGCDVLIASSYKWLNGGYGSAVMYIGEAFLERFPPRMAGFGSVTAGRDGWQYTPSPASFEPGHLNVGGLLQLEAAVAERLKTKQRMVTAHNRTLVGALAEGISRTSFSLVGGRETEARASILCFEAPKAVSGYLSDKGFVVTWRRGLIRVSPHYHNTLAEIEALVEAVAAYR